MYKDKVLKYIHFLCPEHIKEYAKANNIEVNKDEIQLIYNFIMDNYKDLLENEKTIQKLKPLVREDLYKIIHDIYKENKAKNII